MQCRRPPAWGYGDSTVPFGGEKEGKMMRAGSEKGRKGGRLRPGVSRRKVEVLWRREKREGSRVISGMRFGGGKRKWRGRGRGRTCRPGVVAARWKMEVVGNYSDEVIWWREEESVVFPIGG
ncbi:hypothetical protein HAX54_053219 [Datura stramonium]|uniref:Uncharacterized protein n=1 Tax=Datura stramonium TaxID=4076 RepID=A0ABS8WU76_DATST|nr:hypothetical protein [Datura stramonium]